MSAARDVARGLTDLQAQFDTLKSKAKGWLEDDAYSELRRQMEEAHAAIRAAAEEARRRVVADEERDRRSYAREPYSELRELRKERGLSQWGLARLSGVSRPTIHRLEHSQQRPRADTLAKLAAAFDVEPEWIWYDFYGGLDEPDHPIGIMPTSKLWEEMMPTIKAASRKYASKYGIGTTFMDDLEGAGVEGFLKACQTYDPGRGPLRPWLRRKANYGVNDEARRIHNKNRYGPSVDYLEEKGFELGY